MGHIKYIIIYAVMKDSSTKLHKISFTSSTIFLPLQHQLQIPPWRSLKVSQTLPFIGKHDSPYALQQEYMQNASWPQNVSHRTFSHNFHFIMLINYIGHLWCLQSLVGLHLDLGTFRYLIDIIKTWHWQLKSFGTAHSVPIANMTIKLAKAYFQILWGETGAFPST